MKMGIARAGKLAFCVILLSGLIEGCAEKKVETAAPPPISVVATPVIQESVPLEYLEVGTTSAPITVNILARVKGFLQEVHFTEGADVKKGDLLYVIDERPFQVSLSAAKAEVEQAKAALTLAIQGVDLEREKSKRQKDIAARDLAKLEVERFRITVEKGASPREQLERSQALLQAAQEQVNADDSSVHQAELQQKTDIQKAQANLDSAKAKVAAAELELSYCRITAPVNGRIGRRLQDLGSLVGLGDDKPLAVIDQLDPIEVQVRVSGKMLPRILEKMETLTRDVTVEIRASKDYLHPHKGRVTFVDNTVDPDTSTVLMKASIPNPEKRILPGVYVETRFVLGTRSNVLLVPQDAIISSQRGQSVFVVQPDGTVKESRVTTGAIYNNMQEIRSGLAAKDLVIIEGVQKVRPGIIVKATVKTGYSSKPTGPS